MNAKSDNLRKADEPLRDALDRAKPGQTLQAVIILDADDSRASTASHAPRPGEFTSRAEYRQAAIDRRATELAEQLGPVLKRLRDLGLEVRGGHLGRTVVVTGPASKLLASLDIPAVRQAALDRPINLDAREAHAD